MCWLSNLFKPKPKPLVLPYPEEKPDYTQTIDNVNVNTIITGWLVAYFVPLEYRQWWRDAIIITLRDDIFYPARTWEDSDGKRHLDIKPAYLNHGVIAHEQAHNSYDLLSDDEKLEFETVYTTLYLSGDKWLKLMDNYTDYVNYPIDDKPEAVETHAEVYRYLGYKMPEALKQYYPKLFIPRSYFKEVA